MPPEEDVKLSLTHEWLAKAEEDLLAAERMNQPPPLLDVALFHCQQATEKAFKAFLTWHDRPFRKTHELSELLLQCQEIDQQFADLLGSAKVLTQYATQTRYPGTSRPPALIEAETALRFAREAVAFVVARLP